MKNSAAITNEILIETTELKRIFMSLESAIAFDKPVCIALTSAVRGEGKSTLVAGLAAIAAQQTRKKVLALDLNWYSPALHTFFDLNIQQGNSLLSGCTLLDFCQKSHLENLDILTAPAMPSGFTGNTNEKQIIEETIVQARKKYDITLIDTSKVYPVNRQMVDPITVSRLSDGVMLVVLANRTQRQKVKRACTALDAAGANTLGVIVNQWKNPLV